MRDVNIQQQAGLRIGYCRYTYTIAEFDVLGYERGRHQEKPMRMSLSQ